MVVVCVHIWGQDKVVLIRSDPDRFTQVARLKLCVEFELLCFILFSAGNPKIIKQLEIELISHHQ